MAGERYGYPCTATVPTWFTDAPSVCPIHCWYPAVKPTTGATEVTVTLTGTDATSGVDYIRYSVDGSMTWAQAPVVNGYGPNTFQTTFVINGIGEHTLSHLVFDVAGNLFVLGDQIITIEGTTPAGTMLYMPRLVITLDILGTAAE